MKLSCSRCRTSASFSFFIPALLSSCYSVHSPLKPHALPQQDFFPAVELHNKQGTTVAQAIDLSCNTSTPLRLQVELHSSVQVFTPRIVVAADNKWHAEIDGLVLTPLPTMQHDYLQLRAALCRAVLRRGRVFHSRVDGMLLRALVDALQVLSPPCQITYRAERGLHCELDPPSAVATSAAQILARIKRRMVNSWQRQPYLLTRRLALALDLAQILSDRTTPQLARFCHVLSNSLVRELPLIFTSQRWQQSVCRAVVNTESRKHATLGLALAVRELALFTKFFELASHRGNVALDISAPPRQRFWVMLTPTVATITAAVRQFQRVLATRQQPPQASQCWHPFFAETPQLHHLSQALALHAGECRAVNYPQALAATNRELFGNYLVATVTSETEFVISNGRTKFLRLPSGTYRYRVSPLANYYLPTSQPDIARGALQWHRQRRNHQVLR